jgi:hypothetical protein
MRRLIFVEYLALRARTAVWRVMAVACRHAVIFDHTGTVNSRIVGE